MRKSSLSYWPQPELPSSLNTRPEIWFVAVEMTWTANSSGQLCSVLSFCRGWRATRAGLAVPRLRPVMVNLSPGVGLDPTTARDVIFHLPEGAAAAHPHGRHGNSGVRRH
jgi:hypothetical protein